MDPNSVKSALESLGSTESNNSNSKSSTSSTTSNNNSSSSSTSNPTIKQPIIPKRKSSKASTSTTSSTSSNSNIVSSNLTGNALLGASKFKIRGNNPLTSSAANSGTSTSSVTVDRDGVKTIVSTTGGEAVRESVGGVKKVQEISVGGREGGNEKMLPPSNIHRNSISSLNNEASGSTGIERKNSKGNDQTSISADRFLRSSTSRPFNTSSHQTSVIPQSISPPPRFTNTKSTSVGINRSQTDSPLRTQISQVPSYHTSTTSSTLDTREIEELHDQDLVGEEEEQDTNTFEGREILPHLTRETSNSERSSTKGIRRNQTFVNEQEDEEDEDIVLVDRHIGSSGGGRSTSRRSHSREIVPEDVEDFKPDDQDIPRTHYRRDDLDEDDGHNDGIDSLRMSTNSRRDGMVVRGLKRIGEEDLNSHTGGTVEKYRMVYDHDGRSYRAPQNHHNHYESQRDEHQIQDQQYLSPLTRRYPTLDTNEYQIRRSHSPYATPQTQIRQAQVPDLAISTTTIKFNPLSSLTTLFPNELNPHYHLANLRLNQEIELDNENNDGVERDEDDEGVKGSRKSNKWEECSMEEWEKGGEVLKKKFGDLMSRMIEVVVRKATRTKEYEKRMEEHQIALKEREQAIAGTWSNVGNWAGELVGLK